MTSPTDLLTFALLLQAVPATMAIPAPAGLDGWDGRDADGNYRSKDGNVDITDGLSSP